MNLMTAKKVEEFKSKILKSSSFNLILVIADEKKIDSVFIGSTPKRKKENETRGKVITPGWKKENQWILNLKEDDKHTADSYKNGLILNTNNSFQVKNFPNHMSFNWGDEQRLLRATKMINSREFHSIESFKELQNDFISEPARTLLPLMGKELWFQYDNNDPDDINDIKTSSLELLTIEWRYDEPQSHIYQHGLEHSKTVA